MTADLKAIGRDVIIEENERVRPELERRLAKLSKREPPKPKAKPSGSASV